MRENLINPQPKDQTPTWIKNKHGAVSCVPAHIANNLLRDKNKGFELTEPEFVPKKQVRLQDDDKRESASKRANSDKTYYQFAQIIEMTVPNLKEYAKENEIDLRGRSTKKQILEAIEESGKLA
jgi:hypothetical protein